MRGGPCASGANAIQGPRKEGSSKPRTTANSSRFRARSGDCGGARDGPTIRRMARLGPHAARVVDEAHALARRHRHAEVEPEHVLRVLAGHPEAAPVFLRLAIEGATLAE